jgi:hypothetical protein
LPLLTIAVGASMLVMYAVGAWLPALLIRAHGLTTGEMGLYGALATGVCGGLGSMSGLLCDRFRARVAHVEGKFVILASIAAIPLLLVSVGARDAPTALAGYFALNVAAFAWLAPATRLIQDAVGPDERALAFAVCGGAGLLFSLGIGVPLIGLVSDLLAPALGARALAAALALIVPLAALAAIAGHVLLMRAVPGTRACE